jgi:hypothetical protein
VNALEQKLFLLFDILAADNAGGDDLGLTAEVVKNFVSLLC